MTKFLHVACAVKGEMFIWKFLPSQGPQAALNVAKTAFDRRLCFGVDNALIVCKGIEEMCDMHKANHK